MSETRKSKMYHIPMPALAYSYRKAPGGRQVLTSPFDGRIAINNTHTYLSYTLLRDLEQKRLVRTLFVNMFVQLNELLQVRRQGPS